MQGSYNDTLTIGIPLPPSYKYLNYFNALEGLGAVGVKVASESDYRRCDGLLLPGGVDVSPSVYGEVNTESVGCDSDLDDLQLRALKAFIASGKPILGICRGHQLINAFLGGKLIQNLPSWRTHKWDEVTDDDRVHETRAEAGSWIASIYGESFATNSAHHQAVALPGEGMVVDQTALDGVIEATHHSAKPIWSVQWHPERMCFAHARQDTVDGSKVIAFFLDQCSRWRFL